MYPKGYGAVKFVKVGINTRTQNDSHSFTLNVLEIFQHPSYDTKKLTNDLGLLKLDRLVPLSEFVLPICLPQQFLTPAKAIASGFGKTAVDQPGSSSLLKVTLERFTQAECQQTFGASVAITNDTMICYGHHTEAKDSCNGDSGEGREGKHFMSIKFTSIFELSGGPLQIYNRDPYCTYTQIGVVSFGLKKCGTIGTAGAYVNVYHYLDWIEGIVWSGDA